MFRASASPRCIRRPAPQPGSTTGSVGRDFLSGARHRRYRSSRGGAITPGGLRIVDLSRARAGPDGTCYLADFGAEVIKVETAKYPPGREPASPSYGEVNRKNAPLH